jgi:hypothetical protein
MGNDIADVLALALLYGLEGKNEARLTGTSVSKANLHAAAFCDAIARFYAGQVSGAFGAVGRTLPVGLADDRTLPEDTPMLTATLSKLTPEGKPAFPSDIHRLTDTAPVDVLIRNALTAQQDQSVVMLMSGPANDLVKVLDLPGAKEWVEQKVKFLAVAAGSFPDGPPEPNIRANIVAAKRLFAEWPTTIIAAGKEVGAALPYPGSSIEKDFSWNPNHPVADAYRAYKAMPYDAPVAAMAAALYAVRPQEGYFKLSDTGRIAVLDDGRTRFSPSAEGRHRYLIVDPAQHERVIAAYTELASAKPVPRQPRFRPGQKQQQQQQQQPEKETPPAKPAPAN